MFSHLREIKEVGTRFSCVRNHACGFHACVSHEMTRAAAALFGSRLSPHVARCSYSYTSALRPASLRQAARYGWVRAVRVPTPLHVGAFVLHTCRLRRPRPFLSVPGSALAPPAVAPIFAPGSGSRLPPCVLSHVRAALRVPSAREAAFAGTCTVVCSDRRLCRSSLLAALLASPVFVFSLYARLSCALR